MPVPTQIARRFLCFMLMAGALSPLPGFAHPHEFVDTGLTSASTTREGSARFQSSGYTTILILEDLGMDSDGDGKLTEAETASLTEMAGNWPEAFDGNLYLTSNGATVPLSGPLEATAGLRDGRLYMSFIRALTERVDPLAGEVALQTYDPSYYTFYDLKGAPGIFGREGCEILTEEADTAGAQKLYDAALAELTDEEILEQGKFPEIGGAFAATLRLTCAPR